MLFPLHPQTPRSKIFTALNIELLNFLDLAILADEFNRALFTDSVGQACWGNKKTRHKFVALWEQLILLSEHERRQLYISISSSQDVRGYFSNRALEFPEISPTLLNQKLAELTVHLFTDTKKLAGIRDACEGETIQLHFNNYRRMNGKVCQVCGTEPLAQYRTEIAEGAQWLPDYDHLLSKDKYPAFAVHPDNLLPICHTCNSKAKLAKQLLIKKQDDGTEARRLSFYPYEESCQDLVKVELHDIALSLELTVLWDKPNMDDAEKVMAWNEVYQMKRRVEGELGPIITRIENDCRPKSFFDFKAQLSRMADRPEEVLIRSESWVFWKFKLYQWIEQQGEELKERIWLMILDARSDRDSQDEFGI